MANRPTPTLIIATVKMRRCGNMGVFETFEYDIDLTDDECYDYIIGTGLFTGAVRMEGRLVS